MITGFTKTMADHCGIDASPAFGNAHPDWLPAFLCMVYLESVN